MKPDLRRLIPIAIVFCAGLWVRLYGLTWGLPCAAHWYSYHPDERDIAAAVFNLDFFGGKFNPHFYNYPSLYIYLAYIVHGVMGLLGMTHLVGAAPESIWPVMREIMLSGRIVSALLGAATVAVVFGIGREWEKAWDTKTPMALLSAILMAFVPGHVQHSHFATVDVAMTFFSTLSLFFATRAYGVADSKARDRQLLLSAICAGLAAATKYNGIVAIVAPLAVVVLKWGGFADSVKKAAWIFGAAIAAFIVGCPGAVFSFHEFWGNTATASGFSYELLVHPRIGSGDIFTNTGNGWWYHLTFNLPFAASTPLLLLAATGFIGTIAWRTIRPVQAIVPLCVFALLYFLSLGFSQVRFMRYTLPLLPPLCLVAAAVLPIPARKLLPPVGRYIVCAFVGLAVMVAGTWTMRPFDAIDSRDQAAAWMVRQQGRYKRRIKIGLLSNPWFYTPPFVVRDAPPPPPPKNELDALLSSNPKYSLVVLDGSAEQLRVEKPDYVVVTEFEYSDKIRLKDKGFGELVSALQESCLASDYEFGSQKTDTWSDIHRGISTGRPHDFDYVDPAIGIYEMTSCQ